METTDVKNRLIEIVKDLFAKESYDDISLSRILKEANLSKGGLYWYFDSKAALFRAVYQSCCEQAVHAMNSFDRAGLSAVETLKARLLALLELNQSDPRILSIITKCLAYSSDKPENKRYPNEEFQIDVATLVDAGIESGEFKRLPSHFLREFVLIFNKEMVFYFNEHPEEYSAENARLLIDQLFLALTT